ncbi:MAG: PhoH family protein, partial [Candidatus Cyclobacteriaceae bacterium M3_2C_046]
MVEKVITLENVSLIDFLGVENQNINEVASAFPRSKIVSRGNEIRIKGTTPEIIRINDLLNSLLAHYHKFGKVTFDNVKNYLHEEEEADVQQAKQDVLIYGTKGTIIRP